MDNTLQNPKPKIILNQITYFLLPKIVLIIPTVIVRPPYLGIVGGRSQLLITVGGGQIGSCEEHMCTKS